MTEHAIVSTLRLRRLVDVSGVSGIGVVAYGVQFPDGTVVLRWDTKVRSTVFYDSIEDVEKITGHGGNTVIEWGDEMKKMNHGPLKPGHYYRHTTGGKLHVLNQPVVTEMFGDTMIAEHADGRLRPVSTSASAAENWIEITREEFLH